jgi:hypothetical protein
VSEERFLLASERARLYQVITYGADKQFSARRMIDRMALRQSAGSDVNALAFYMTLTRRFSM